MPFNATTGVYTPAAGAETAAPGDLIQSTVWNAIFTDLSTALTEVGQLLGTAPSTPVASLALASGGVIDWDTGGYQITESTNTLTLNSGNPDADTILKISNTNTGASADSVLHLASGSGSAADLILYCFHDGAFSSLEATKGNLSLVTTQASTDISLTPAQNIRLLPGSDVVVKAATATPANGSTAARLVFGTTGGFGIYFGSNVPTVSAAQGSLYLRSDGASNVTRAYINTNGSTTWTAINTVG